MGADRRVYATLVTSNNYLPGALTLAHSIRASGSLYPIFALVPPTQLSKLVLDSLYRAFDRVIHVPLLRSGAAPNDATNLELLGRPELDITLTKLHVWNPDVIGHDVQEVAFMDADAYVVRNACIDNIFNQLADGVFAAAPDVGWPDIFNSGVFVLRPSKEFFGALLWDAQYLGSFDGGDQGLLNSFFSTWSGALPPVDSPEGVPARPPVSIGRVNRLPFFYNVTPSAVYSYLPAFTRFHNNIVVVHFAGTVKPWKLLRLTDGSVVGEMSDQARDLHTNWWSLHIEYLENVEREDRERDEERRRASQQKWTETVHFDQAARQSQESYGPQLNNQGGQGNSWNAPPAISNSSGPTWQQQQVQHEKSSILLCQLADTRNDDCSELESRLAHHKMREPLEPDGFKFIGSSNFAVFKLKVGLERFAVKNIPYKHKGIQRRRVLEEIDTLLKCSGSSHVLSFVGWEDVQDEQLGTFINIIMQYCEGGTLTSIIKSTAMGLPPDTLFSYLRGIISGIVHIHIMGIIHNDIKPDNILVSRGQPMISDFGSATPPGFSILGTPGFMCPESQLADELSDAFSVGITLFEMYKGQRAPKHCSDEYKYYALNIQSVPDQRVKDILEVLIVPKGKRSSIRKIADKFPETATLEVKSYNLIDEQPPSRWNQGLRRNNYGGLRQPPNDQPNQSQQPARHDIGSVKPRTPQPSTRPAKLARFPQIQEFWREHISDSDDPVPIDDFVTDTILGGVSRTTVNFLKQPSKELETFSKSIANDASQKTVSPRSFGIFLMDFSGTEEDSMESALLKIFAALESQSNKAQTMVVTSTANVVGGPELAHGGMLKQGVQPIPAGSVFQKSTHEAEIQQPPNNKLQPVSRN